MSLAPEGELQPPMLQMALGSADDPGSIHGLAVAGSTVLATHYGKSGWGALHQLDRKTLQPIAAPMAVGHVPRAVSWHPARNQAYVMNWGKESYSLTRCDLATGETENIPVGFGLVHMAVDPASDVIYTADWAQRKLRVIQVADPTQRHAIDLPAPPTRLAVADDGAVMVTVCRRSPDPPIDALCIVRPDGSVRTAAMTPARLQPSAVAVGHNGTVYVGSLGGGGVHPLVGAHDPDTGLRLGAVAAARGVRDLAAHPHLARAWMATDDGAQMADLTDVYVPKVLPVVKTGRSAYSVTVGDDGDAYVGDNRDGTVTRIEPILSDVPLEAVATLLGEAGHHGTLTEALISYQTFHELPVTGLPDVTTVGHLTEPGCGTPDKPRPVASFTTYSGRRLGYTNVTYYIGPMIFQGSHPDFTRELAIDLLRRAFEEWKKVLSADWQPGLSFRRVFDPDEADIVISVGDAPDFHNSGWFRTVYAVSVFPGDENPWKRVPARIPMIFNEAMIWAAPGYVPALPSGLGVDFLAVATHELGHCLGLNHGSKKGLMARNATWYRIPKDDDANGLRSLYGTMPFYGCSGFEALPGASHAAYQDFEQHLSVYAADGASWSHTRPAAEAGARRMKKGSFPAPVRLPNGRPSYVYTGDDEHIHQLWWDGAAWAWSDLTDATGAPPPSNGSPYAYSPYAYRNDTSQRVVYIGGDGAIVRLSQAGDQPWQWEDITLQAGAAPAIGTPLAYPFGVSGLEAIAYRDEKEGLRLLLDGPEGWTQLALSELTQNESSRALLGNPILGMAPPGVPHSLFALDLAGEVRVFSFGDDGAWHTRSLSAELGLPVANHLALPHVPAGAGDPWSLVVAHDNGDLNILRSAGETWTREPVTVEERPKLGLWGIAAWSTAADDHITYIGADGNLYVLSRPLGNPAPDAWRVDQLTAPPNQP